MPGRNGGFRNVSACQSTALTLEYIQKRLGKTSSQRPFTRCCKETFRIGRVLAYGGALLLDFLWCLATQNLLELRRQRKIQFIHYESQFA